MFLIAVSRERFFLFNFILINCRHLVTQSCEQSFLPLFFFAKESKAIFVRGVVGVRRRRLG